MSIKRDLENIKEEFQNDGRIFESAFQLERIFQRYKWVLVAIIVLALAGWVYTGIKGIIQEKNAKEASQLYTQLAQNHSEETFKQLEQKAPQLAEFLLLKKAVQSSNEEELKQLENSKNEFIKDFATYQIAMLKKDIKKLGEVKGEFSSLAKFEQAFLLIQDKQITQAKEVLQSIPQNSNIHELSKLLAHYGVLEKKEKN